MRAQGASTAVFRVAASSSIVSRALFAASPHFGKGKHSEAASHSELRETRPDRRALARLGRRIRAFTFASDWIRVSPGSSRRHPRDIGSNSTLALEAKPSSAAHGTGRFRSRCSESPLKGSPRLLRPAAGNDLSRRQLGPVGGSEGLHRSFGYRSPSTHNQRDNSDDSHDVRRAQVDPPVARKTREHTDRGNSTDLHQCTHC